MGGNRGSRTRLQWRCSLAAGGIPGRDIFGRASSVLAQEIISVVSRQCLGCLLLLICFSHHSAIGHFVMIDLVKKLIDFILHIDQHLVSALFDQ